jgi:fluoride exporter
MIWLVALGGALGSVSRFLLGPALQRAFDATFPVGTLFINITGSLILGFVMRLAVEGVNVTPEARAFIAIGFCGGFTTFSTFSFEAMRLLEDGEGWRAAVYVMASVLLSLAAAFLGLVAARELMALRR